MIDGGVLKRSLSPAEIKTLLDENLEYLAEFDVYFTGEYLEQTYAMIDRIEKIAYEGDIENDRPITFEEFSDEFQTEIVYGVVVDQINKRIIVIFRGTTNKLAFRSNWKTNLAMWKKTISAPDALKGVGDGTITFHAGFHGTFGQEKETYVSIFSHFPKIC